MENKLKQMREKKRLTQEELSKVSGVSRTTISNIENGYVSCVKTETLVKLSDALGVKVTTLFF